MIINGAGEAHFFPDEYDMKFSGRRQDCESLSLERGLEFFKTEQGAKAFVNDLVDATRSRGWAGSYPGRIPISFSIAEMIDGDGWVVRWGKAPEILNEEKEKRGKKPR